jgi:mycofactocin precursor
MDQEPREEVMTTAEAEPEIPAILEDVVIEELAVDGICGIY